jgi:hypothetical protein
MGGHSSVVDKPINASPPLRSLLRQSVVEDFVKDVQAKYKADRAVLKEAYKAMPKTPATPNGPARNGDATAQHATCPALLLPCCCSFCSAAVAGLSARASPHCARLWLAVCVGRTRDDATGCCCAVVGNALRWAGVVWWGGAGCRHVAVHGGGAPGPQAGALPSPQAGPRTLRDG